MDWTNFSLPDKDYDIESGLTTLTTNIQSAIDTLAPDKTINLRKTKYPWINSELRLLKSKLDATDRRYCRTGSRHLLDELLSLSRSYEEQSETARCAYIHNRICSSLDANRNFWRDMRGLGLIPKINDSLHGFLPEEMSNHFSNISFSSIEDPSASIDLINNSSPEGFSFNPVTITDVILAVSHFKSQAKGEDGIPQSIIAKALPSIAPYLMKLFNASLEKGIFPSAWKKARIIVLKKVSVPSSPSDFRPIALLCFLSKVLEKLTKTSLVTV